MMTLSSGSSAKSRGFTVVACDDGYIEKVGSKGYTLAACISWRGLRPGAPVRGALALLRVDGAGATGVLAWLASTLAAPRRPLLLLDSITIAGFDVVSPQAFKDLTGGELIVVYTSKPRGERLLRALGASGAALKPAKARVLEWMLQSLVEVETRRGTLYLASTLEPGAAARIVEDLQGHARKPEPLRVAHATASRASLELWRRGCLAPR